jgi:hypothetical protein
LTQVYQRKVVENMKKPIKRMRVKTWRAMQLLGVNSVTWKYVHEFLNAVDDMVTGEYLEKDPVVTDEYVDLYSSIIDDEFHKLLLDYLYKHARHIHADWNVPKLSKEVWERVVENAKGYEVYRKYSDRTVYFKPDEK